MKGCYANANHSVLQAFDKFLNNKISVWGFGISLHRNAVMPFVSRLLHAQPWQNVYVQKPFIAPYGEEFNLSTFPEPIGLVHSLSLPAYRELAWASETRATKWILQAVVCTTCRTGRTCSFVHLGFLQSHTEVQMMWSCNTLPMTDVNPSEGRAAGHAWRPIVITGIVCQKWSSDQWRRSVEINGECILWNRTASKTSVLRALRNQRPWGVGAQDPPSCLH